ncbi:hypothetical protein QP027_05145 [Corynebacterium breve]|uniref:Secreted protein n=1 Tax=Corynebacterium breve TaxID=3049799 RepID=A0ABY8VGY2_9CORY|nr:hypothetical protein [Corynebacterium breve]WIM68774.1 hypothetical protein QP027_05145 [Corynebacterium breve]
MDSSNTGVDAKFFTSRKNIVGVVAAVLVIILHLSLGLGALWPVAAVAAWGAGVALTPPKKPKPLPPPPPEDTPVTLERTLRSMYHTMESAGVPQRVVDEALELDQTVRFVLNEWHALEADPDHQTTMWNIVQIYYPQVIETYMDAPDMNLPAAMTSVIDSLDTLTGAVGSIKQAILDHNVRALDSHARTLREQFGNLPGLSDGSTPLRGYDEQP